MKIFVLFSLLLAFVLVKNTQAQSNPYPNELKGYEFFGNGKLKELILGFSKREDVEKIFGKDCEISCDYNEKWIIQFNYFDNLTRLSFEGNSKVVYVPDVIYLGKIHSIQLRPKTNVLIKEIVFSSKFKQLVGVASSALCSHCGDKDYWMNFHNIYIDRYGLSYTVFDEVFKNDSKDVEKRKKGDLISIGYEIPEELEEKMFIEKK